MKFVNDFAIADYRKANPNIIIICRVIANYPGEQTEMTANNLYDRFPNTPESAAQFFMNAIADKIRLNPGGDYWEGLNEPGFESDGDKLSDIMARHAWYGRFEAERLKILHDSWGLKGCVGNFSVGRPWISATDNSRWAAMKPMLMACRLYKGVLGLHEYKDEEFMTGLDTRGRGDTYGRFVEVHDYALVPLGFPDLQIVITELGRYGSTGYRSHISGAEYAADLIKALNHMQAFAKEGWFLGACLFTCGHHDPWANMDIEDDVVAPTLAFVYTPSTPTPPPPVPQPAPTITIQNPSFESAMTGWSWVSKGFSDPMLNPTAEVGQGRQDKPWSVPEVGSRPYTQFQEGRYMVTDKDCACHVRQPNAPLWTTVYQRILLPPGTFKISLDVLPDVVKEYVAGNKKVYPKDGDSPDWYLASEVSIFAMEVFDESKLIWDDARVRPIGKYSTLTEVVKVDRSSVLYIGGAVRCRWGFAGVGFLMDNLRIEPVTDPVPTPPPPVEQVVHPFTMEIFNRYLQGNVPLAFDMMEKRIDIDNELDGYDNYIGIAKQDINFRAGPSLQAKVIMVLKKDQEVVVSGNSKDEVPGLDGVKAWVKVARGSALGYVSKAYLELYQ